MRALDRPAPDEYGAFYGRYVELVPDGDILDTLTQQFGETLALLQGVSPERELHRYAPGKFSVRGVVGHLVDTERVLSFRALAIARSDGFELPSMDPDEWGGHSNADERVLDDLAAEWAAVRRANVHMFDTLGEGAATRRGSAAGHEFTPRAFAWIIAGHERWHRARLREDYGIGAPTDA